MTKNATGSRQIGLIFGKFYPLHSGHIFMLEKALSQVDELHVMLGCEESRDLKLFQESRLPKQPQVKDRLHWLQETFRHRSEIHIHVLDEAGIAFYPNGWKDWSDRVKGILQQHNVKPTVIFTSEPQDADNHAYYYNCPVTLIDAERSFMNISATKIRHHPYENWSFIAKAAQPFFVKKIAIMSNKQSGNLAKQFANFYNADYISNGYVNYIKSELGSHQHTLQESDYAKIALLHAERLEQATLSANRFVFTDLDFSTLQTYFRQAFHHNSTLIEELLANFSFDLVISVDQLPIQNSRSDYFEQTLALVRECLE